jgi:hypothetical protein
MIRTIAKNGLTDVSLQRRSVAEREGFEPSVRLNTLHSLSRRAPSASRSSLR